MLAGLSPAARTKLKKALEAPATGAEQPALNFALSENNAQTMRKLLEEFGLSKLQMFMSSIGQEGLAACFARHDKNGDGRLASSELRPLLSALVPEVLHKEDSVGAPGTSALDRLLEVLDADGDGTLDLRELQAFWFTWFHPDAEKERMQSSIGQVGVQMVQARMAELGDFGIDEEFRKHDKNGDGMLQARLPAEPPTASGQPHRPVPFFSCQTFCPRRPRRPHHPAACPPLVLPK